MGRFPDTAVERTMKVQEVILRAINGRLKWFEAAEILAVSEWRCGGLKMRFQQRGHDGLFDQRRRSPSPCRVGTNGPYSLWGSTYSSAPHIHRHAADSGVTVDIC